MKSSTTNLQSSSKVELFCPENGLFESPNFNNFWEGHTRYRDCFRFDKTPIWIPQIKEFNFWNMDASRLHFKWFCWGGIHVIVVLFPEVLYKGDVCAWEDNSACFHSEKYCIILMLRKLLLDVFQHYPKALCSYSSKCSIRWLSFLLYFLDLNMQKLKNERREKLSASFQCCSMICHKLALIQIFFAWSEAKKICHSFSIFELQQTHSRRKEHYSF